MVAIFVSYSRKDAETAYELADHLRAKGHTVWTDVSSITGGAMWHAEIEKAITRADTVIVVLSQASKDSQWVQKEILFALDLSKPLIPVRIENVSLPLALINLQPIDYLDNREKGLAQLIQAFHQLMNTGEVVTHPPSAMGTPERQTHQGMSLVKFRRAALSHPRQD